MPQWASGEPKQTNQCVAVNVATTMQLETADCSTAMAFICEVIEIRLNNTQNPNYEKIHSYEKAPDTRNATTSGRALQSECAESFNISLGINKTPSFILWYTNMLLLDVMDSIMNLTAQDMTVTLKVILETYFQLSVLYWSINFAVFHQMHRRNQQHCKYLVPLPRIFIFNKIQWTYGGLNTEMILMLMETVTPEQDDRQMQIGINALDKCSKISLLLFALVAFLVWTIAF
jgi:hypothetical protein